MIVVALVVLKLPDGRLVFQRRDGHAAISPYLLGLFGGHIEAGESPDEAVARELAEETSLAVSDAGLEFVASTVLAPVGERTDDLTVHVFIGSAPDDDFEVFEGTGAESYELAAVLARADLAPTARSALELLGQS